MNKIVVTICKIDNIDNLNIVQFEFEHIKLKMMSLDLNENIKVGQKVILTMKPTNIAIAKNLQGELSYSNQIKATVTKLEKGNLLSILTVEAKKTLLESIITTASLERLNIKEQEEVTLLIKASDISILEVIND
jgi:molybdopterin-binding protein